MSFMALLVDPFEAHACPGGFPARMHTAVRPRDF
jgi:hypothetical protein